MKKLVKSLLFVLVVVLSLGLVACSGFNKVEKTLNGLGYYESGIQYEDLRKIDDETNVEVKRVLFTNLSKGSVMVFEFESVEDMKECYDDSETLKLYLTGLSEHMSAKDFHNTLTKQGYAKKNCLVVPITIIPEEKSNILNAIKKA